MDRETFISELVRTLTAAAAGLVLALLALLGASALISSGRIPETRFFACAALCAGLGALLTGFVNGRGARSRVLPAGLAAGAVFLVLLLLFGALFFPQLHLGRGLLPIGAAVLAGAGLGAVLSAMGRR